MPATIVYDPNTSGINRTLYTTVTRNDGSAVVVRSTTRGVSWVLRSTIPASAGAPAVRGRVNAIYHHPSQSSVLFLCTQGGIFKSTDGAATLTRMNGTGSLPTGEVLHAEINPSNGSEIYVCVNQTPPIAGGAEPGPLGLWHTTNGGTNWSQITVPSGSTSPRSSLASPPAAVRQPAASRDMYLIRKGQQMLYSHNGG